MSIRFYAENGQIVEMSEEEALKAFEEYFAAKGKPIQIANRPQLCIADETPLGKLYAQFTHDDYYHSLVVDVVASRAQAAPYLTDLTPNELAADDEWDLPVCTVEIPEKEVAMNYTGKTRNLDQPGVNIFLYAGLHDEASHIISIQPGNEDSGISMKENK